MSDQISSRYRSRRQKRSSLKRTVIVVVVGLIVAWFGWSSIGSNPKQRGSTTVKVRPPHKKQSKAVVSQQTILIMGVEDQEGQKRINGMLELVFDPARNRVGGLIIDPNTYVSIPGRGYQSIHDGLAEGPKNLEAAVTELIGIETEGWLVVPGATFQTQIDAKNLGAFFKEPLESSMTGSRIRSLGGKIAAIPADRVNLSALPVKTIIIGEQSYYEPEKKDLKRLVTALWGREPKEVKPPIRVIILNGNGNPGVARTAADRLIGKGFKVIDVKNADNFNYKKTEVLIYNQKARKSGPAVAKALGAGVLVDKETAQDVTDIVIVVGKDFH